MSMAFGIMLFHTIIIGTVCLLCEPFQLDKNNLNKALVGHAILEINGGNHHECARMCMSTSDCKSLDYNGKEKTCKLNDVGQLSSKPLEFEEKIGASFSFIEEWPSNIAGVCGSRPCLENQACYDYGSSYKCRDIACTTYELIEHGYIQVNEPGNSKVHDKAVVRCNVGYIPSQHEVECQTSEQWQTAMCNRLSDCKHILDEFPEAKSGQYELKLWKSGMILTVNCDMNTDGGGWTIFHQRFDGSVDFYRNFTEYEYGFGNIDGEHWLGLKYIQELAEQGATDLRLDMTNEQDGKGQETFQDFVLTEGTRYKLNLGLR